MPATRCSMAARNGRQVDGRHGVKVFPEGGQVQVRVQNRAADAGKVFGHGHHAAGLQGLDQGRSHARHMIGAAPEHPVGHDAGMIVGGHVHDRGHVHVDAGGG